MVRFLHGGWLLFLSLVWQPDSIETGATAALPTFNYLWGTIFYGLIRQFEFRWLHWLTPFPENITSPGKHGAAAGHPAGEVI
jgi:hypothetical protein